MLWDQNFKFIPHLLKTILYLKKLKKDINPHETYELYTDGTVKGNPGQMGVGYMLNDCTKKKIYDNSIYIGPGTNNQAEYIGVIIYGLR